MDTPEGFEHITGSVYKCLSCGKPMQNHRVTKHRCPTPAQKAEMQRRARDTHKLTRKSQLEYIARYADKD